MDKLCSVTLTVANELGEHSHTVATRRSKDAHDWREVLGVDLAAALLAVTDDSSLHVLAHALTVVIDADNAGEGDSQLACLAEDERNTLDELLNRVMLTNETQTHAGSARGSA